jgi:mono/diheme cytochrome c family protein
MALALFTMPLMAEEGAAIYKAKCAICHGADGAGQTPMGKTLKIRDLHSAGVQKMSDNELTTIISDGKGKMPAYKGKLAPAEISALVDLIRKMK